MLPILVSLFLAAAGGPADGPVPSASRQLVVVTTPAWSATSGTLHRFSRGDSTEAWRPVGTPVAVVVGRAGLGWGRGLHPDAAGGPRKAEGDGRAPAGVFVLTEAFGYAPADSVETGLPYLQATPDLECVDDTASEFYNRLVVRSTVDVDWDSHEEMRRSDVLYRRGVVVAHNADPTVPSGGSCIFLHIWRGPRSTTSGCTAMPEPALADVIGWLDEAESPVIVQLPASEYRRLRRSWGLPNIP
jgi:D-alanyl-D-alanine dipeptidase